MANIQHKTSIKKPKLVRDSFTIPKAEFAAIEDMKVRAMALGLAVKKSELLRAGLKLLQSLSDSDYKAALAAVPTLKTGRPSSEEATAKTLNGNIDTTTSKAAAVKSTAKSVPKVSVKTVAQKAALPVAKSTSKPVAQLPAKRLPAAKKASAKATVLDKIETTPVAQKPMVKRVLRPKVSAVEANKPVTQEATAETQAKA